MLDRAVRMLRPVAEEKGVSVQTDVDGDAAVIATAGELHQILYNLAENAIKYNRQGGFVRVSTQLGEEFTAILVEDGGIGIPEGDLDNVFKRFYRVDTEIGRAHV